MGVDLGDLVPKQTRRLQDFQGKLLAIDAYNAIYQFLSIIRQPDGTPLKDAQGRITSHLSGLFYRTANLAEAGIKPVFVFDGKPDELKFDTLAERRERKVAAEAQYKEAIEAGDTAKAFSKAQQTSRLTGEMVQQSISLLDALGIPWIQAPGEGEAQAAHMARKGDVWAAASQDFDALLFGAPRLVRNLSTAGRRKLPGKSIYVDVEPEVIELDAALKELALTREQLIALGMLVGTDFNPGIKGVGPKRGLKLVQEEGTLVKALARAKGEVAHRERIEALFLAPRVTDEYSVAFGKTDNAKVVAVLCDDHGFSKDRVNTTLERYAALADAGKQRSLDAFF